MMDDAKNMTTKQLYNKCSKEHIRQSNTEQETLLT